MILMIIVMSQYCSTNENNDNDDHTENDDNDNGDNDDDADDLYLEVLVRKGFTVYWVSTCSVPSDTRYSSQPFAPITEPTDWTFG